MIVQDQIRQLFGPEAPLGPKPFPPFGDIVFPFTDLGKSVNSLNLFGEIEQRIFEFYWRNRNLYHRVADVGANIGLHSIIMQRCGWEVTAYEPDPVTFAILQDMLHKNEIAWDQNGGFWVHAICAGVSSYDGVGKFMRLVDNITGSCMMGHKPVAYGPVEHFEVVCLAASSVIGHFDLVKMDIEGHEGMALTSVPAENWDRTDVILEVSTPDSRELLFRYCRENNLRIFSEQIEWREAQHEKEIPSGWEQGSAFITRKDHMP